MVLPEGGVCIGKMGSFPTGEIREQGNKTSEGPESTLRRSGVEEIVRPDAAEELLFVYRGPMPDWWLLHSRLKSPSHLNVQKYIAKR